MVWPRTSGAFSTAAFRLGHSLLGADVEFLDNNGDEVHEEVPLREAFFNPALVAETKIVRVKVDGDDQFEELKCRVQEAQGGLDPDVKEANVKEVEAKKAEKKKAAAAAAVAAKKAAAKKVKDDEDDEDDE